MKHLTVSFDLMMDDTANVEEFRKVVDHHIEQLLDLEEWPEIKAIYNAKSKVVNDQ